MASPKHPGARTVVCGREHRVIITQIRYLRKGDLIVSGPLEEADRYPKVFKVEQLTLPSGKPDGEIVVMNEHLAEILRGLYTRDVMIFRPV